LAAVQFLIRLHLQVAVVAVVLVLQLLLVELVPMEDLAVVGHLLVILLLAQVHLVV
jgi:hypothetical protein